MPRARRAGNNGPGLNSTAAQVRARKVYDAVTSKKVTSVLESAITWVNSQLADGPVNTILLNRAAKEAGHLPETVKEARKHLGCLTEQEGAIWWVRLPEHAPRAVVAHESFNDLEKNFEACEDQFNVSREERQRLGIKPDEQVCWMRSPEVWSRVPGAGNLGSWKQRNPGARVIMDNGQYVYNGDDVVLCVVPRTLVEERLHKLRHGYTESGQYVQGCVDIEEENALNEAGSKRSDDFDLADTDRMYAIMRANKTNKQMQGPSMFGGTKNIEAFMQTNDMSEVDMLRHETLMAMPSLHNEISNMSDKELQSLFEPEPERGGRGGQPRGGGGKFASIAPIVRPRNLMSEDARRQQDARTARLAVGG